MKSSPLVAVFLTLTPCLVYAQNQQFFDCRPLAVAGNFVGAEEALVDGLVCKVRKPKTSVAGSTPAAAKAEEGSQALLGIIEPEILRSKENAGANPGQTTPGGPPGSGPSNPRPGRAAPFSEPVMNPKPSLGEIARAFRKEAAVEITASPEPRDLEQKKPANEEVAGPAVLSETNKTPIKAALTETLPAGTTEASSVPAAAKPSESRAVPAAPPATPEEAPASKEVTVVPQTLPSPAGQESSPGAGRDEAAMKQEASVRALGANRSSATDVQAPPPAATPASAQRTPTSEQIAASSASGATADAPVSNPELVSVPEIFSTSARADTASRALPPASRIAIEEDSLFREGQTSNCNKNVSLGSLDKDKLFLAIPDWALKWYEKNQKRFPRICFSDSLMPGAKNYLVVFYMAPPHAPGTESLAKVGSPGQTSGGSGEGSFTASYGSTWHYTYESTVTTTILSVSAEKAPHNQPSTPLYARAYSEQGTPVSHDSPTPGTNRPIEMSHKPGRGADVEPPEFRAMQRLLSQMMEAIAKQ